ncbi:hypothetical protein HN51_070109 [Arachis hypogaea]
MDEEVEGVVVAVVGELVVRGRKLLEALERRSEFKITTPLTAASIRDGGSFADRSSDSASIVVVTVEFVGGS